MIITSIDPSLRATGYALAERSGVLLPPRDVNRGMERNNWIMRRVLELAGGADVAIVEGYSFGSQGRAVFDIAELGGIIRWALWTRGIPYVEVPPANLKLFATGKGNSPKDTVLAEAIRRLGYSGSDHNEADALWLRAMAFAAYGAPIVQVPKAHERGLQAVNWTSPIKAKGGRT